MQNLVSQIKEQIAVFTENADQQVEKKQQGSRNPRSESGAGTFETFERFQKSIRGSRQSEINFRNSLFHTKHRLFLAFFREKDGAFVFCAYVFQP